MVILWLISAMPQLVLAFLACPLEPQIHPVGHFPVFGMGAVENIVPEVEQMP